MTRHTPGPWAVERHGVITAVVRGVRRQVASTTGDAPIHDDPSTNVVELQMANAHVIGAAPELLEALRGIIGLERRNLLKDKSARIWVEAALAAIAKAEGRS